jgi:uncharacterized protein
VARPLCILPAGPHAWLLKVWVQPGARRNGTAGQYQGCLKIRITSPPVDDKANKAVSLFVADALGLRPHQVSLESGRSSRRKVLRIEAVEEPVWIRLTQTDADESKKGDDHGAA